MQRKFHLQLRTSCCEFAAFFLFKPKLMSRLTTTWTKAIKTTSLSSLLTIKLSCLNTKIRKRETCEAGNKLSANLCPPFSQLPATQVYCILNHRARKRIKHAILARANHQQSDPKEGSTKLPQLQQHERQENSKKMARKRPHEPAKLN